MSELKQVFEVAGFSAVTTVLSSGNVVFDARRASEGSLEQRAEAAMRERLGKAFLTIMRPTDRLRELLATDPYRSFDLSPSAKRIVTFLRDVPAAGIDLPVEHDGARLIALHGTELFSAYLPSPRGPVFMALIGRTFGKELTTRTWDTVARVARA